MLQSYESLVHSAVFVVKEKTAECPIPLYVSCYQVQINTNLKKNYIMMCYYRFQIHIRFFVPIKKQLNAVHVARMLLVISSSNNSLYLFVC